MYFLYTATGLALLISFIVNKDKTFQAVKMAYKKLAKISPAFFCSFLFKLYLSNCFSKF